MHGFADFKINSCQNEENPELDIRKDVGCSQFLTVFRSVTGHCGVCYTSYVIATTEGRANPTKVKVLSEATSSDSSRFINVFASFFVCIQQFSPVLC